MRQSDSVKLLAEALAQAQAEMPIVPKDKDNPFFKSKYADLATVVQTVIPVITRHGLAITQFPDFDGDHDLLTTRLLHSSGEWLEASMRVAAVKQDPQALGSALTYAKRYAFCAILGIVADEDDDGNAASAPVTSPQRNTTRVQSPRATKPATDESPGMRKLFAMLKGIGIDESKRHQWATEALGREVKSFKDLGTEDVALLERCAKDQQINKPRQYAENDAERPF